MDGPPKPALGPFRRLALLAVVALATLPFAGGTPSGTGPGVGALLGAGLAGLAGLTLVSERWRGAPRRLAGPDDADRTGSLDAGDAPSV